MGICEDIQELQNQILYELYLKEEKMIDLEKTKMRDCPFCGGRPWIDYDPETKKTFVSCRECHARTVGVDANDKTMFHTEEEAEAFVIGAWERTPED